MLLFPHSLQNVSLSSLEIGVNCKTRVTNSYTQFTYIPKAKSMEYRGMHCRVTVFLSSPG